MPFILKKTMPEILKKTQIILSDQQSTTIFNELSPAYLFTTENISGYLDNLNLEGKDVLTVVGSGDHILNAILKGAKKVDAFDISTYAIMLYYLKEAAIKTLTYQEFIEFFFYRESQSDYYKKIRLSLEPGSLTFWDYIYNQMGFKLFHASIFRGNYYSYAPIAQVRKLSFISSYLTEKNYNYLKTKINDCKITCYQRECKDLYDILSMYDYMFFSNIIQYQIDGDLEKFRTSISRYFTKLEIGGEIKVGYLYGFFYKKLKESTKSSLLNDYELEIIPSITLPFEEDDYVLTLRRNKNGCKN